MAVARNPFGTSDHIHLENWERQQMMVRREELYIRDHEQAAIARAEKKAADDKRTKLLLTTR